MKVEWEKCESGAEVERKEGESESRVRVRTRDLSSTKSEPYHIYFTNSLHRET